MGRADDGDEPPLVSLRGLRPARPTLTVVERLPGPPRERADAARNRERILKAARRLMRRKSLDTICMDAIAEAAGVGKGTLYRRFPDRAALAHALLDEDARQLQERALAGFELPPSTSAVEHALALLGAIFDFSLDHAAVLVAAQAQHPRERYTHPAYVWQRSMLMGHLRAAVRNREVVPLEPLVTAELMLAGTKPELLAWITGELDEVRVRAALLATWRRALSPPPA